MNASMQASPISDLLYDWLTLLQAKAEGLNAYEKSIQDAERENAPECAELFQKLHDQDVQQVEQIKDHLIRMLCQQRSR
jgi:hypothetical protein